MSNAASWASNVPSGTSYVRHGDDHLRSNQSVLEAALDQEHYFTQSASSGSAGIHAPGSARIFTGPSSKKSAGPYSSSADNEGRLYFDTTLGSLHVIHSSSVSTIVGGTQTYSCQLARNDSQVVASVTYSQLTCLQTKSWDYGNYAPNPATYPGTLTVPSDGTGLHVITASISYTAVTGLGIKRMYLTRTRGASVATIAAAESSSTWTASNVWSTINLSHIDYCNSLDTYKLIFWTSDATGGTVGFNASEPMYFSIAKIVG